MKVDYHEVDKTIEKILACEKVPNITAQFVEVYSFEILDLARVYRPQLIEAGFPLSKILS